MRPVVYNENGIQISVIELSKNKEFECSRCGNYTTENCDLKKKLSDQYNAKKLVCTEIIVVFANMTNRTVSIRSNLWEVVDTDGLSYGCCSLCDSHIKPRTVNPDRWDITPGTQVKFSLAFPQLEEKTNIVALLYSNNQISRMNSARIYLRKPTKKVEALLIAKENYQAQLNVHKRIRAGDNN